MNGWRVIWGRRERSGLRFPRSIGEISGDYRDDGGDNEQIDNCENDHHGENQPAQKIIGQSSSEVTSEQQRQRLSTSDIRTITQSRTTSEPTKSINFQSPANSGPLPHSHTINSIRLHDTSKIKLSNTHLDPRQ